MKHIISSVDLDEDVCTVLCGQVTNTSKHFNENYLKWVSPHAHRTGMDVATCEECLSIFGLNTLREVP